MDRPVALEEAWARVDAEAARLKAAALRDLVAAGPGLAVDVGPLHLSFRFEALDGAALSALLDLARASGLEAQRDAFFAGAPVNVTEGRAALHMALRGGAAPPEGADVAGTRARMLAFAEAVRSGEHGAAGGPVRDVVNIGIGGSDLGPAMAARALSPHADGPRLHFVSNVDGAHLADTLADLDPARTLLVVVSKSFTTQETMMNARTARAWLEAAVGAEAAGRQMAAVSTNLEACAGFGIEAARVFGFWDWVGGRYSVWSSVGLSLAIGLGAARFEAFLAGAAEVDRAFREGPLDATNAPLLFGLLGVWRRAMGASSVALIPYDQRLERFPAYVQQLEMESNGKRVTAEGTPVARPTSPVIWGEPGTNAQHSFFQLLHQGTERIPVDFILAAEPSGPGAERPEHHAALTANGLAQARALALGRTEAEARAMMAAKGMEAAEIDRLAPHRTFPGDRPSTTLLMRRLEPRALGALVALFEHRVFVQAAIWGINAFDQWGVELGKELAQALLPIVEGAEPAGLDPATVAMLAEIRRLRAG